jgi:ubiquinone/menaquinone biosynthesis C-methylase UbiE
LEINLADWNVNDYDDFSEAFDASMGEDFASIIFEPTFRLISKTFRNRTKIRHLDIACGTGIFLLKLAQARPTEGIGIDLSKGQISRAESRARRIGVKAAFHVGDIRTLSSGL